MELETSKGEVRDHLLLNLNDELLNCSAAIYGTTADISTEYNEIKLVNFLAGKMNYTDDKSAVLCIEHLGSAKKINPKGGDKDKLREGELDNLVSKELMTSSGQIYSQYRIIPESLSTAVTKYGLGKAISDGDIFTLEAIDENGAKITTEGADSTGKYQLIYYDKDRVATVLETISLYMTNQS